MLIMLLDMQDKALRNLKILHCRELQEKLNVPVGLIVTVWGGTPVEAWTSRAALLKNPETKDMMRNTDLLFGERIDPFKCVDGSFFTELGIHTLSIGKPSA